MVNILDCQSKVEGSTPSEVAKFEMWWVSSNGKTRDCGSRYGGFNSPYSHQTYVGVVQW